ncbi:F-box protein CPR1-like [Vicia villosa]|uniref:F-box protein CPR1-like n=1 Tax=Vicia villosa TaxID=3911 RepID=UPI00273AC6C0|nr:F-box protein CPR1-like [Vicia villosa]
MSAYCNTFLSKDHSYYSDKSLLLFCQHLDDTFHLYSVSDERFEILVRLNWPKVTLDQPGPPAYYSGFDILGLGSVNGILCLISKTLQDMILWNPSTEEFKVIPPNPFDSGVWEDHTEFGYDSLRNDFKVMRHMHDFQNNDFNEIWEIYSVRNNSWKKLDVGMRHYPMENKQLYIVGLSHWLCKTKPDNKPYLLSFDWSNEVFLTTPSPSNVEGIFTCLVESFLVLLNGSIALIICYKETYTSHILILSELGVRESWTKIFNVGRSLSYFNKWQNGGGKKGRILFDKDGDRLAWFDLNTQMVEDLDIFTEDFCCFLLFHKENLHPFEGKNL